MKRILFTLLLISVAFVGLSFISAADVEQTSTEPIVPNDLPYVQNVEDIDPIVQKVNERPTVLDMDDERPTVLDIDMVNDIQPSKKDNLDISLNVLENPKWHSLQPHSNNKSFSDNAPIIGFNSQPTLGSGLGGGGSEKFYSTLGSGLGGGGSEKFYSTLGGGLGGGGENNFYSTLGSGIGGGDNPHII